MIQLRPSGERGHFDFGWLKTYHTFSFGDYDDPKHRGFRALRVINEDWVRPGEGFPTHAHRDMEILTYILEGQLQHKDSMGTGSVIKPGDIQRMSAGSGVTHSEFNASGTESVHLLQIWIFPEKKSLEPSYEQQFFTPEQKKNNLCLIASNAPSQGAVKIHQDAKVYASVLDAGKKLSWDLPAGRHAWLQIARGGVRLNDKVLGQGDGAAVSGESRLTFEAGAPSEFLLFDLA
jgi:hypothetical protein